MIFYSDHGVFVTLYISQLCTLRPDNQRQNDLIYHTCDSWKKMIMIALLGYVSREHIFVFGHDVHILAA